MHDWGAFLLTIIYYYVSFTQLLSKKLRLQHSVFLMLHYVFLLCIEPYFGQWLTFSLAFGSAIIIYFASHRNLLEVILSLSGYQLTIVINHLCTIPLTLAGISFDKLVTDYAIPLYTICVLLTLFLLRITRKKFIAPKLFFLQSCPRKLQHLFLLQLLICVCVMALNFIYGDAVGFPSHVLTFNGVLISIFSIFTIILFYNLYTLLQENYELNMKQKEQELLKDYTQRMESFYDELRTFRHDYRNILATMQHYIEEENMASLKDYFEEKILPSSDALSSDGFLLGKLHLIEIPAVKSLLYVKLIAALNQKLNITLELTEPVTEIAMDEVDLSRMLGIFLDNAREAALQTEEKLLHIAIVVNEDSVIFSIINSTLPIEVPLSRLEEKGYTCKESHDGLGLFKARQLLDPLDNVFYQVNYDGTFRQTLEIRKEFS